jgi:hypothetical protein
MIVRISGPCSSALASWLASSHDDGRPALRISGVRPGVIEIWSSEGPLTPTEQRHVQGVLAAERAEKFVHGVTS